MDERRGDNNGHASWFTGLLERLESAYTEFVEQGADTYVENRLQSMESSISSFCRDLVDEVMSSSFFSCGFEQPEDGVDSAPGFIDRPEEEQQPADASAEETSRASNSSGSEREKTSQEILGSSTGSIAGAIAGFSHINTDMPDAGITLTVSTEEVGEHSEDSSQGLEEPIGFFDSNETMLSSSEFSTDSCPVDSPDAETAGNNVPEVEPGNHSDEILDGSDGLRHDMELELCSVLGSSGKCCDQASVDGLTGLDGSATQFPIETTKPSDETKLSESFIMVKCYGDCSIRNGKPRRRFSKGNTGATIPSGVFPVKNGRSDEQNPSGAKSNEPTTLDRNIQGLPLHSEAEDWELSDSEWEII